MRVYVKCPVIRKIDKLDTFLEDPILALFIFQVCNFAEDGI
jgi:hypothetical protein